MQQSTVDSVIAFLCACRTGRWSTLRMETMLCRLLVLSNDQSFVEGVWHFIKASCKNASEMITKHSIAGLSVHAPGSTYDDTKLLSSQDKKELSNSEREKGRRLPPGKTDCGCTRSGLNARASHTYPVTCLSVWSSNNGKDSAQGSLWSVPPFPPFSHICSIHQQSNRKYDW